MRARIARGVAAEAGALAGAAGLGFVARDLLGLGRPLVALAWLAGALIVASGELGPKARRAVRLRRAHAQVVRGGRDRAVRRHIAGGDPRLCAQVPRAAAQGDRAGARGLVELPTDFVNG